jgi:short-subunit dehydrogenase
MKEKLTFIKERFSKCQTMQIVADFSDLSTLDEYRKLIETNLQGIDVGIVCLNAGITVLGNLSDLTD